MEKGLYDSIDNKQFYKMVFILVIPMALQNLINVGVSAADVVMLGKVSETAVSAASLAGQIQYIMTLIFFGLTSGAAVLTAQYWGKRDIRTIEKVLAMTIRFALVVAVIFTIAAQLIPEQLIRIYSTEQDVIAEGVVYLKITSIGFLVSAVTMIYLNIMRSVERVIISTVVYFVSLIINIVLNSILIFGLFGLPKLGVVGAAYATLTARISEFVIVLLYSKFYNKEVKFHVRDFFITDKLLMKDFIRYALPVVINELMWGLGTSANTAIIGHLGKAAVAGNAVAQVTRQLATVVTFGLANATAITVGKAIGEGKQHLARGYARKFMHISIVLGVLGAGLILLVSPIARANLSLTDTASSYLKFMMFVMSYFTIGQAFNTTMIVGIFRAGGDTVFGLILDVTTMWCCSILLGFLAAFVWNLPVQAVYVILMSDEIVKVPLTYFRYRSCKWLKNVTR